MAGPLPPPVQHAPLASQKKHHFGTDTEISGANRPASPAPSSSAATRRGRLEPAEQVGAVLVFFRRRRGRRRCRGGDGRRRAGRELRRHPDAAPDQRPSHEEGGRAEAAGGASLRLGG